ncbi:hypothetical protein F2Q68_00015024 [Brassica cretica]|uniref:Uncharacterized protein n=1 Tax=Brassica cretica TaxID=69181 RepID=A0A8S9HIA4_BRACR|nr:hypothetical protein F2Q68_00015024 [Brassica cretica]
MFYTSSDQSSHSKGTALAEDGKKSRQLGPKRWRARVESETLVGSLLRETLKQGYLATKGSERMRFETCLSKKFDYCGS